MSFTTRPFRVDEESQVSVGTDGKRLIFYYGSGTIDFASIATATAGEGTLTVTGAAVGDPVFCSAPAAIDDHVGISAYVSAADTVTVRLDNVTAGAVDPASATFSAIVVHAE